MPEVVYRDIRQKLRLPFLLLRFLLFQTVVFAGDLFQCIIDPGRRDDIFFYKFGFFSLKQSDNRTAEFFAVLGNLLTGDRAVNELIFNRLAVVDCNLNIFGILSRIAESKRILAVGKDIMLKSSSFVRVKSLFLPAIG